MSNWEGKGGRKEERKVGGWVGWNFTVERKVAIAI